MTVSAGPRGFYSGQGARVDDLGRWAWEPWRDQAACRNADPSLFYGHTSETAAVRQVRVTAAKQVCAACPVRVDCLTFAEENGERTGMWGGLTGEERAARRLAHA
jgi:WhiB family transcriptional regulator, redox-sensing transcriptional regulator